MGGVVSGGRAWARGSSAHVPRGALPERLYLRAVGGAEVLEHFDERRPLGAEEVAVLDEPLADRPPHLVHLGRPQPLPHEVPGAGGLRHGGWGCSLRRRGERLSGFVSVASLLTEAILPRRTPRSPRVLAEVSRAQVERFRCGSATALKTNPNQQKKPTFQKYGRQWCVAPARVANAVARPDESPGGRVGHHERLEARAASV